MRRHPTAEEAAHTSLAAGRSDRPSAGETTHGLAHRRQTGALVHHARSPSDQAGLWHRCGHERPLAAQTHRARPGAATRLDRSGRSDQADLNDLVGPASSCRRSAHCFCPIRPRVRLTVAIPCVVRLFLRTVARRARTGAERLMGRRARGVPDVPGCAAAGPLPTSLRLASRGVGQFLQSDLLTGQAYLRDRELRQLGLHGSPAGHYPSACQSHSAGRAGRTDSLPTTSRLRGCRRPQRHHAWQYASRCRTRDAHGSRGHLGRLQTSRRGPTAVQPPRSGPTAGQPPRSDRACGSLARRNENRPCCPTDSARPNPGRGSRGRPDLPGPGSRRRGHGRNRHPGSRRRRHGRNGHSRHPGRGGPIRGPRRPRPGRVTIRASSPPSVHPPARGRHPADQGLGSARCGERRAAKRAGGHYQKGNGPQREDVRRRPTLPPGPPGSTIGAEGLNFRVRNGTGCFPFAMATETLWRCRSAHSSGDRNQAPDRISGTAQWTRNKIYK